MKISPMFLRYLAIVVVALALIAALAAWGASVPDGPWNGVSRILMIGVVVATGPAVMVTKKRGAKMMRSDSSEGMESEVALRASSAVFYDALVLITAVGTSYLVFGNYLHPALMALILLATLLIIFLIRHAVILKRLAQ